MESVVQRLFTETIAREIKRALLTVPQCDGEHPDGLHQCRLETPSFNTSQQCLRIGVPPPTRRPRGSLELFAQIHVVIDLAIEDDDIAGGRRDHGLVARRRKVNYGKSAMTQHDPLFYISPITDIVWPTMRIYSYLAPMLVFALLQTLPGGVQIHAWSHYWRAC